jgi:hypothetical protein
MRRLKMLKMKRTIIMQVVIELKKQRIRIQRLVKRQKEDPSNAPDGAARCESEIKG